VACSGEKQDKEREK